MNCTASPNLPHVMIVSDKKNTSGLSLLIHNLGLGAQEEDRLGISYGRIASGE